MALALRLLTDTGTPDAVESANGPNSFNWNSAAMANFLPIIG
jgi:hypothetical protein